MMKQQPWPWWQQQLCFQEPLLASGRLPQASLSVSASLGVGGRAVVTGAVFGLWGGCGAIVCPLRAAGVGLQAGAWLAAGAEAEHVEPYAEADGLEPLLSM